MSSRRSLSSVVVVVSLLTLSAIALAGHRATPRTSDSVQMNAQELASSGQPASNWVFEGCWESSAAGPCYDIYRDSSGNYWKCAKCGTTKNPSPHSCSQISQEALNHGFWCS
jgi:hypothetical protein